METIVTPKEITENFNAIFEGRTPSISARAWNAFRGHARNWRGFDNFAGCTGDQMAGWLAEGYFPPKAEIPNVQFSDQPIRKRRYVANDEAGDLQVDAVLAGDDYIYREYTQRVVPRNVEIKIDCTFSAMTNYSVITEYLDWCLQLAEALQQRGLSPGISIFNAAWGGYNEMKDRRCVTMIPLNRAGEAIDSIAWRAFFTKGGYRMLIFLAKAIAGDKHGWTTTTGLGRPDKHRDYDISFDSEDSSLTIVAPATATSFDSAKMNSLLDSVGIL